MQTMTLEQWHSNDRKGKINTRTCVKNKKKLAIRLEIWRKIGLSAD